MHIEDFYFWIDWLKGTPTQKREAAQKWHCDKIADAAIKRVKDNTANKKPPISNSSFFGATQLDPKHLSIWYFFPTLSDVKYAENSGYMQTIRDLTLAELTAGHYPKEALPEIAINFASDEEVQRDYDGNYFEFLR